MIKQVSLFLENKNGSLARVCKIMGEEKMCIRDSDRADRAVRHFRLSGLWAGPGGD